MEHDCWKVTPINTVALRRQLTSETVERKNSSLLSTETADGRGTKSTKIAKIRSQGKLLTLVFFVLFVIIVAAAVGPSQASLGAATSTIAISARRD